MINPIKLPEHLISALEQREVELRGLMAMLRFAYSDHHNYIIPEEKINDIYIEYIKTQMEYSLLKEEVYNYIPNGIPKTAGWSLDFNTDLLEIPGYTLEIESEKKHSNNGHTDMLQKVYGYREDILSRKKECIEVTFQVTEACSLACKYCYQHNKTPKVMTIEVGKKIVDTIFTDLKDSHYAIILSFIGGEPLLQPELISNIVDYWDYKCIMEKIEWGKLSKFSICTNGTEYRKKECQKLMNKIGDRLSFTVSIDGNKELHDSARIFPDGRGSYDLAMDAACDYESKFKADLGSKMTIAPSNIIFLFPAIKHYLNQGKEEIFANCVYEEGWTYEDATLFYNELKKLADYMLEYYPDSYVSLFEERNFVPMDENDNQNWCGGNGLMLASDPDGVLYPCLRYMPSSIGDKQEILTCGHVDSGIDTALLKEMQKITRRSQSTDECFYCPIATGCSWCTAYNYEVFGTIDKRATFICPMHKARALANVYYWNKYYKLKNIDKVKINYCPKEWALEIIDENEYEMLNNLALR